MNSPDPCALIGILDDGHAGLGDAARRRVAAADLVIGARRTLERVGEVADATREQSAASTSIAQRVEEISHMVENTSENIRGAADAAIALEQIATGLKEQIARFKI